MCLRAKLSPLYKGVLHPQRITTHASRSLFQVQRRQVHDAALIRNIGIIAHIDAGKTTTTERMLYYSGFTRRIGNVDDGSTVTDFLPAERERGVTIQSAAITFQWPPKHSRASGSYQSEGLPSHQINLIDTPGHADFTFEVLRSLRILDGAVCILDGVAGVEAQTEMVWNQAAKYDIPRLIYVNKLDRDGASFQETVRQIALRLRTWPVVCHIPRWDKSDRTFVGIGDAIHLRSLRWSGGTDGSDFVTSDLETVEKDDPDHALEIRKARHALVESLTSHDADLIEAFFDANEDAMAISATDILASLRRCVIDKSCNIVPVFAGASFRNMGVQPLLDAVVQLLPSPLETHDPEIRLNSITASLSDLENGKLELSIKSPAGERKALTRHQKPVTSLAKNLEACALAFKVVHDARKGMLVYVRVYQGVLRKGASLFNTNLQCLEKANQLMLMYASDSEVVDSLATGQIGVIPGLKITRTGDTLISYAGINPKNGPPAPINRLQLRTIDVPPAVFFSSIEPHSVGEEKSVRAALDVLIREDPSLQLSQDDETGQLLLSGMGEFHLEIARDRLVKDMKAKAIMGDIEIAYRESILRASSEEQLEDDNGCHAHLAPLIERNDAVDHDFNHDTDSTCLIDGNRITIIHKVEGSSTTIPSSTMGHFTDSQSNSNAFQMTVINGTLAALSRGIKYGYPIHGVHATITLDPSLHSADSATSLTSLSLIVKQAVKKALRATSESHGSALLELVMNVTVSVDEGSLGTVASDISSARGGHIVSLEDESSLQETDQAAAGIDISKVYVPADPFAGSASSQSTDAATASCFRQRSIIAKVPLKEMVGYLKYLRSLTGGRGTFVMNADRFERVVGQREKTLVKELRGY